MTTVRGTVSILRFLLPAAALALAVPAAAQPFDSDVTGPIITGSGVAGVGYHGAAFRDVENALFRHLNGRVVFRSAAIADAVTARAAEMERAACAGQLQAPPEWRGHITLPEDAQRVVCGLLARPGLDTPEAREALAALAGVDGVPGEDAVRLVAALAGLFRTETEFVDTRGRFPAGERWEQAFRAYEEFLDDAPASVLDPPPAILAVTGLVLRELVVAGVEASRR